MLSSVDALSQLRLHTLLASVLLSLAATSLRAQEWVERTERPSDGALFVSNALDGRPVAITETALWAWDGLEWQYVVALPQGTTTPMLYAAADLTRGEVMVQATLQGQSGWTLIFDGVSWAQFPPPATGAPTRLHYDPTLGQIVGFVDPLGGSPQDWAWNGSAWVLQQNRSRPAGLLGQPVADLNRNRVVLVSEPGTAFGGQTWEWDGTSWAQRTATSPQGNLVRVAMVFDPIRGTILRHGGDSLGGGQSFNDSWEWDGTNWTQLQPTVAPTARAAIGLVFDPSRERIRRVGGAAPESTDWEWDGTAWSRVPAIPARSNSFALTTDFIARQIIRFQFEPTNETWLWDGTSWALQNTPTQPSPRRATIAWNPTNGRTLLFGGAGIASQTGSFFNDTWEWDGAQWLQANPANAPTPRNGHAISGNLFVGGVLLFGGRDATSSFADTWLWNGTDWIDLTPSLPVSPPAGFALFENVYPGQNPHLISGGELWQWVGGWQQLSATIPAFSPNTLSRDASTGRTVMTGLDAATFQTRSWEWDGQSWSSVVQIPSGGLRAAIDPVRRVIRRMSNRETLVYTATPSQVESFGSSCGTPAPVQLTQGRAQLSAPGFALAARTEPNGAAVFLAGLAAGNQTLNNGCILWVAVPQVIATATANGQGFVRTPLPIPAIPSLRGVDLFLQSVSSSSTSPNGLALSQGLRVRIGD